MNKRILFLSHIPFKKRNTSCFYWYIILIRITTNSSQWHRITKTLFKALFCPTIFVIVSPTIFRFIAYSLSTSILLLRHNSKNFMLSTNAIPPVLFVNGWHIYTDFWFLIFNSKITRFSSTIMFIPGKRSSFILHSNSYRPITQNTRGRHPCSQRGLRTARCRL